MSCAGRPGEEVILASFCPFSQSGRSKIRSYFRSRILLTNQSCARHFLAAGKPEDYFGHQFVLRAYNHNEEIIDGALVSAESDRRTLPGAEVAFVRTLPV
jgi:hypothetical protein